MNPLSLSTPSFRIPTFGQVIPMPKLRGDRYKATKRAVRERCLALHLNAGHTAEAIDHAATLYRKGRSAAVATAEGIRLAKMLAKPERTGWDGAA